MQIRPIRQEEIVLLTDFIYEAIYQKDGGEKIPRTVIQEKEIWAYIDRFGTGEDDHCLVVQVDGYIVGAVWVRCIEGFGHVSDNVPEFAVSVYPQYRGKGLGTALMREMLALLKEKGYEKASLAVQKDNYAVKMYEGVGFRVYGENEQEWIMVCDLGN